LNPTVEQVFDDFAKQNEGFNNMSNGNVKEKKNK
jgi:hypothetical protein